jgi:putative oxidoreductase
LPSASGEVENHAPPPGDFISPLQRKRVIQARTEGISDMKFLEKYSEQAYALLRIFAGLLFVGHGAEKLLSFPVPFPMPLNPLSTAAGCIELVGGALIAIGLFTRPAAFIASGMCAVGYFMVHVPNGFFPIVNGGEQIALYSVLFLFVATRGAGIWSIEAAMKKG